MRRLAVISLVLLLEASAFSAALPASAFESSTTAVAPASSTLPSSISMTPVPDPADSSASAAQEPVGPPAPASAPAPYVRPQSKSSLGIEIPRALDAPTDVEQQWWYQNEQFTPRPDSVIVGSTTSIVLFIKDGSGFVQIPTDADLAAGARPVTFANNSTLAGGWLFTGKLFETTVGNQSINVSHDMDIGVPNQTLSLSLDGAPFDPTGVAIATGGSQDAIFAPLAFAAGIFTFAVPRFTSLDCGPHALRVTYDNQTAGNNATFYASSLRDFRLFITCETTLTVTVDLNPATVGDNATFYGTLVGSKGEAVPGRAVQVVMDGQLLGQTAAGAFVDELSLSGTNFTEDFENNGTGWNQTGAGTGTWTVGKPTLSDGPISLPGSIQLAGTGLERYYGKGVDTWLTSPEIDLSNPSVQYPQLLFNYWYNISFDDRFEVAVSTDAGKSFQPPEFSTGGLSSGFETTPLDPSGHPTWTTRSLNLTSYVGTSRLVIGFHFFSVARTAFTNNLGVYSFRFQVPYETEAKYHSVLSRFSDGIPLDPSDFVTVATDPAWDLTYQSSLSIQQVRLKVLRLTHFVFNITDDEQIGFRGKPLEIRATLFDNLDQVPVSNPEGDNPLDKILLDLQWDLDYNDPFDTPKILARDMAPAEAGSNEFKLSYVVDVAQPLGLHNVTFIFKGSDYYVPAETQDLYRLMAHTYVVWPPDAQRQVFRFSDVTVNGTLRIIPSESRLNKQVGDTVDGELVHITFTLGGLASEIPEGQVGVLTDASGNFLAVTLIPFDEELGKKPVFLTYPGSDIYTPLQSGTNWSVVSRTSIQFENTSVYKGSYLYFNGTMLDDRGVGVSNQTLTLFLDNETVQVITTNADGTYSYPHFISTDMAVGAKQVFVRFSGNPVYLNSSITTFVAVRSHTQISRTDHTQIVDRGKRLNVTGEIFEIYEGGVRGSPVGTELVQIRIEEVPLTLETSNSEGKFSFKSAVPAALTVGQATMFFEYAGSDFYDPSANNTEIVIRGQSVVAFDRDQCFVNGAPFNVSSGKINQKQEVECTAYVTDELGNPISNGNFRGFYAVQTGAGVLSEKIFISTGPIDELGRYKINVTWDDFVVGNRTLIGDFNGSFCPTFISARTLCMRPGSGNVSLQYKYEPPPPPPNDPTIFIIAGSAIAAIVGSAAYFFWYAAKRRQLQKMQRIIRRAADRLVAGNPYAQVIFDAYRALARFLQANGYLRKDSETFRQFEAALRQALPIDANSMDEFLSILEEARYSDHEIGEVQKDRAIASLNAVKGSIEQILLSGAMVKGPSTAPIEGEAPAAPPAESPPAEK